MVNLISSVIYFRIIKATHSIIEAQLKRKQLSGNEIPFWEEERDVKFKVGKKSVQSCSCSPLNSDKTP